MKRNNLYAIVMAILMVIMIGIVFVNAVELGLKQEQIEEENDGRR